MAVMKEGSVRVKYLLKAPNAAFLTGIGVPGRSKPALDVNFRSSAAADDVGRQAGATAAAG